MTGALEKFVEHFIEQYPCVSDVFTFVLVTMLFIVSPILIFVLLSERYNRGRYIFERKAAGQDQRDQLYLLDTMKGRLYYVDGKAYFNRVHERDWKEEREKASEGPPTK
jgi:hypothetical protein